MEDNEIISKHLSQLVRELNLDLTNKSISEKEYNKSMANIAYEFSMLGLSDEALLTFINIKDGYFLNYGIRELEKDKEFYRKCSFLLIIFDYLQIVPLDTICNSPPGKA